MKEKPLTRRTAVGDIHADVLAFTVGRDPQIDTALAEADCLGSAAHVTMLAEMPLPRPIVTVAQSRRVVRELVRIMGAARRGDFAIRLEDQDVHMAVERLLTERLGDLGKRIHTGRSRNDQVAVDLRLYGRRELLRTIEETAGLARALIDWAQAHRRVPMVGRTHQQPAMPSSVGLWASAYAESLLDDLDLLRAAYALNDRSPLGAAAGYGVPLPLDRDRTARLLGFRGLCHNVLYAIHSRGKCEGVILSALAQVMGSLSRLAADLILFSMPEFGYFSLPPEYCTGSSIMPQKRNPDVLELIRAKAAWVASRAWTVAETLRGLPGGYNRDVQETKAPFLEGLAETRASVRMAALLVPRIRVHPDRLRAHFTPEVFATDYALELVAGGLPFRDAYDAVKRDPALAGRRDPAAALALKSHRGAPAGLDFGALRARARAASGFAKRERTRYCTILTQWIGTTYVENGG